MEQQPDLTALNGAMDPETFRRVWARVMPDQKNSPIGLGAAPPASPPKPPAPPPPAPRPHRPAQSPSFVPPAPPRPVPAPPPVSTDEERLRRRMDLLGEGLAADGELIRRAAPGSRLPARLLADHRRAMRQLSAAHFLITGRRYRPGPGEPLPGSGSVEGALRQQFLWERRWVDALLRGAEETGDPTLRDLFRELAREGNLHLRSVREALERD